MFFFSSICVAQRMQHNNMASIKQNELVYNTNSSFATASNAMSNYNRMTYNFMKPFNEQTTQLEDEHGFEETNGPHNLLSPTATCYPGTISRFTGSYHSNLYIGNTLGTNVLLAWGQVMLDYTGTGVGNITTPTVVAPASYASSIPLEVRSASSGGAAGLSSFALRTNTKLYVFGTAANITAITTYAGFGGAALTTPASDVTAKLPAGVLVTDIAQMAMSQTAFAIVTTSGHVWVLTKVLNMQGDNAAAATPTVWHHVVLPGGVTGVGPYLTGVTKISVSSSGILAVTGANKLHYWGAAANVAGVVNTTTSYKYAFDMSAQIPASKIVKDVVVLGTKVPSNSTLYLLCDDKKVYATGLNTNGCLGINNATVTFNQPTFITVKGTDGITDLANIVKIDGDTEADIYCIGAQSTTGQIFGWGDSPAGMLGVNAGTGSFAVPRTVQLYIPTPNVTFTDFSISGHFTIAFYSSGSTDQYWYLGHNTGGSVGDPANVTTYILAAAPAPLNSTGGVTFDCSAAVLPLTWLSFNATKKDNTVVLNWSTATEQNTQDFLVQHSTDAVAWKTLDIVQSTGYINPFGKYTYEHTTPASGINYYRLIQQDIDGKNSYSKIASAVFNKKTNLLTIYTNVVSNGKLKIQLHDASIISIYNIEGKLIHSSRLAKGTQAIDVIGFAKGMYMIKAGNETEKFIVR
jgi:hypothetical protein